MDLENIISSGKHEWKFKVIRAGRGIGIGIGKVQKEKDPPLSINFMSDYSDNSLGGKSRCSYGKTFRFSARKVVTMMLDLDRLTLRFQVDGSDVYGVGISSGEYRAVVHMYGSVDEIQLLESDLSIEWRRNSKRC